MRDTHNEIASLNVVTGGFAASSIDNFSDLGLKTLSVSGIQDFSLLAPVTPNLVSISVFGGAGLALGAFVANADTFTINADSFNKASQLEISDLTDANLATVILTGSQKVSLTLSQGVGSLALAGSNYSGSASIALEGVTAASNKVSVVLGNGNDMLDLSHALGPVAVTLGDGDDTVSIGASAGNVLALGSGQNSLHEANGGTAAVTFAVHGNSVADNVQVGQSIGTAVTAAIVITGMNVVGADTISFGDPADILVEYNAAQISALVSGTATLAQAVAGVLTHGALAQHAVGEFVFQGNTYFVEQANAPGSAYAAGDSLVELTGSQMLTSATAVSGGILHLHG